MVSIRATVCTLIPLVAKVRLGFSYGKKRTGYAF
jgi:hypothetical protein